MKKGFTLIELLVVVLIIGILTAVALPKYEKAQRKALFTEVQMVTKNLMTAVEVYGMEQGYPWNWTIFLGTESTAGTLPLEISWTGCETNACHTKAGKFTVEAQHNQFIIAFYPNGSRLVSSGNTHAYAFTKGMEDSWTLKGLNGVKYNSTYQLFCDWWVDGGGATTADFASQCK